MRLLILSIFNKSDIYNEMLNIQRKYIHSNKNIDIYFITFDNSLEDDIKIVDDIIYVKGNESLINILYKTVASLKYIINTMKQKYDYVIRTNISTVINFENLITFLNTCQKTNLYIGGKLETLTWQLASCEISENKQNQRNAFFGLKYMQGIGIIMSYDIVKKILDDSDSLDYDLVDDVKIGLIIRDKFKGVYNDIGKFPLATTSYNFSKESVFLRNKSHDRRIDIDNMNKSVFILYNII